MSLAFPALLILLLVLPGIILRYAYQRGFELRGPFVASLTDEVAYSLIGALALHVFWIRLLTGLGFHISLTPILLLLLGAFGSDQHLLAATVQTIARHPYHISEYFLCLYALSGTLGLLARRIVRRGRLDRRFLPLRFKNDAYYDWNYLISGELFGFPENRFLNIDPDRLAGVYLSTVITQGDQTYLYRGIVRDWFFDRDGNLDRVVLTGAHRRLLTDDRPTDHLGEDESRYYQIRGSYLVIRYSEMQTLNFEYITIEIEPSPDFPDEDELDPNDRTTEV